MKATILDTHGSNSCNMFLFSSFLHSFKFEAPHLDLVCARIAIIRKDFSFTTFPSSNSNKNGKRLLDELKQQIRRKENRICIVMKDESPLAI